MTDWTITMSPTEELYNAPINGVKVPTPAVSIPCSEAELREWHRRHCREISEEEIAEWVKEHEGKPWFKK